MLNAVSVVLEIIGTMLGVNYLYGKKPRLGIYDAVFLVSELCIVESANFLDVGKQIIILSYLVIFLYQMVKFKVGIKRASANIMLLICIVVTLQLVCSAPLSFLDGILQTQLLIIIANLFMAIIVVILGGKGIIAKLSKCANRHEWFLNVCLICCFIASVYFIITYKMERYLKYTDYIIFGIWTTLLCAIIMKWQRTKEQFDIREKEIEMQQVYDVYARELLKSVMKKQHDFDNYIQAMLGEFQTAATLEELQNNQKLFVRDIKKDNYYNKLLDNGNSLVVGFLYSKFINAESMGYDIRYIVKTDELESRLPLYLLIKIMGILFDNAVEAMTECENKEVFLSLIETDVEIELVVSNPFEHVPQTILHDWLSEGYSTKGEGRGLGLSNVVNLAAKYEFDMKAFNQMTKDGNRMVFAIYIRK